MNETKDKYDNIIDNVVAMLRDQECGVLMLVAPPNTQRVLAAGDGVNKFDYHPILASIARILSAVPYVSTQDAFLLKNVAEKSLANKTAGKVSGVTELIRTLNAVEDGEFDVLSENEKPLGALTDEEIKALNDEN